MARDYKSKNKVVRQLNVLHKAVPDQKEEAWSVISKPKVQINGHHEDAIIGLENLTLIKIDLEEEELTLILTNKYYVFYK